VTLSHNADTRILKRQEELKANPSSSFKNHAKVGIELAEKIRQQFEDPQEEEKVFVIHNDHDLPALKTQLNQIFHPKGT